MRPPRRLLRFVAASLVVAAAAADHPSVEALPSPGGPAAGPQRLGSTTEPRSSDTIPLTFDWPLDCSASVEQETYATIAAGTVLFAARYDIELVDTSAPDDVELVFGRPEITDVLIDDAEAPLPTEGTPQHDLFVSYVSNPTLAVELDGSPALDIGFESWLEDGGLTADQFGRSDTQLRDWVDYRATWSTWATWVGRWAELGEVPTGSVEFDASNDLEFAADSQAPLALEASVDDTGLAMLRATSTLTGESMAQLWQYGGGIDPATEVPASDGDASRVTVVEVVTDPATLQPRRASYEVTLDIDGETAGSVSHEWTFDWPECADAESVLDAAAVAPAATVPAATDAPPPPATEPPPEAPDVFVPPGFETVTLDELPPEALDTLAMIDEGGPFPYDQDGAVFQNREGVLPDQPRGYYHEYTVETPGSDDRGARRIVTGENGEFFYTDDHYDSFKVVLR